MKLIQFLFTNKDFYVVSGYVLAFGLWVYWVASMFLGGWVDLSKFM